MEKRLLSVLCSTFFKLWSPFIVSVLFYNSINCRLMTVMQMILMHKNKNCVLWKHCWFPLQVLTNFVSICRFVSSFLLVYAHFMNSPLNCLYHLTGSSVISEINKRFDICSLYICMRHTVSYMSFVWDLFCFC